MAVNITTDTNTVKVTSTTANNVKIVDNGNNTSVTVSQPVTKVIKVATAGPQGPAGTIVNTGSLVTTASFNLYTGSSTSQFAGTSSYTLQALSASYADVTSSLGYTPQHRLFTNLDGTGYPTTTTEDIARSGDIKLRGLNRYYTTQLFSGSNAYTIFGHVTAENPTGFIVMFSTGSGHSTGNNNMIIGSVPDAATSTPQSTFISIKDSGYNRWTDSRLLYRFQNGYFSGTRVSLFEIGTDYIRLPLYTSSRDDSGSTINNFLFTDSTGVLKSRPISAITTFPYTGSALITGSLGVTGSISLVSGSITTSSGSLTLQQTGDVFGTTQLELLNRNAQAGAFFRNLGLDLVDFGFITNTNAQGNLRFEHRSGLILPANTTGEFQFLIPGSNGAAYFQSGYNLTSLSKGNFLVGTTTDSGYKLDVSGSTRLNGNTVVTGSLNVTNGITGSLLGTASYAINAATASNILGGKATHIPFFITDTTLATSSLYQSGSGTVIINQDNATSANPEALYVWQPSTTSINVISGKGNLNNYLQLNIQNTNQGTNASSDVVATANNGDETSNYIDMGINSENFSGDIGGVNDAYLYSTGRHLHIGNASNYPIQFFAGGVDTDANKKFELNTNGQHNMTGSLEISGGLKVNQGITGSLFGTSSWAVSSSYSENSTNASYATTASYAPDYVLTSTTSSMLNPYVLTSTTSSMNVLSSSYALTASYVIGGGATFPYTGDAQITGTLLVTQGMTVGSGSTGSSENTLTLGPPPSGGEGEGGQILLAASGGLYTSASMLDNYQNRTRLLRGTNAGSDAEIAWWDMHTKQMALPSYNSSTAFTGTAVASLTVDSSGNILTGDYPSSWSDYSSTTTTVGWSSTTRKVVRYTRIGTLGIVEYDIFGTSNSATVATFTIPFTASGLQVTQSNNNQCFNTATVPSGQAAVASGSNLVVCNYYSTAVAFGASWSGNKGVRGVLTLEID